MTGSIFNRGSRNRPNWGYSIYIGRDDSGKKRNLFKSGFRTKREADEACSEALTAYRGTQAIPATDPGTLAEFMPRWFEQHATLHCEGKTLQRYRELAAYFLPTLGPVKLTELRPLAIETEMNRLHASGGRTKAGGARPLAAKTVRAIAGVLSSALNTARRWELIAANPVEVIQLPKSARIEQEALDHEQFERVLERAKSSWIHPLLAVAGATGCRRGELLALTWADVDFEERTILISKSLEQTKEGGLRLKSTKGRKARTFPLPASAVAILRDHRASQARSREALDGIYRDDLNLVFGSEVGEYRQPDSVSAMAARIIARAGFPGVSLHNLRHSHGSQLIAAGVPVTDVSDRLGHESPAITMSIYAHALKANRKVAAERWEAEQAKARAKTKAE